MNIYQNIMVGKVNCSPAVRPAARDLMQKLLVANPSKRLTLQAIKKEASAHTQTIRPRRWLCPTKPFQLPSEDKLRLSLITATVPRLRL